MELARYTKFNYLRSKIMSKFAKVKLISSIRKRASRELNFHKVFAAICMASFLGFYSNANSASAYNKSPGLENSSKSEVHRWKMYFRSVGLDALIKLIQNSPYLDYLDKDLKNELVAKLRQQGAQAIRIQKAERVRLEPHPEKFRFTGESYEKKVRTKFTDAGEIEDWARELTLLSQEHERGNPDSTIPQNSPMALIDQSGYLLVEFSTLIKSEVIGYFTATLKLRFRAKPNQQIGWQASADQLEISAANDDFYRLNFLWGFPLERYLVDKCAEYQNSDSGIKFCKI